MSIISEIERIKTNIANAYTELESKGATIPSEKNSNNLASTITTVTGGGSGGGGDAEIEASYRSMIDDSQGSNVTKLPDGMTLIGNYAFYQRPNLSLTSLPETITSLSNSVFYGCTKLDLSSLHEGLTSLGTSVFYNCSGIKQMTLPKSITSIGKQAFYKCTGMTYMKVLSDITAVPENFCQGCTSLETVDLDTSTITSISAYAFNGCSNLKALIIRKEYFVVPLSSTSALSSTGITSGNGYIYVPDAMVSSYKSATNWSNWSYLIKGISELPTE